MMALAGVALCGVLVALAIIGSLWCDARRAAKANRDRWLERFLLLFAGTLAGAGFLMAYLIGEMG